MYKREVMIMSVWEAKQQNNDQLSLQNMFNLYQM